MSKIKVRNFYQMKWKDNQILDLLINDSKAQLIKSGKDNGDTQIQFVFDRGIFRWFINPNYAARSTVKCLNRKTKQVKQVLKYTRAYGWI